MSRFQGGLMVERDLDGRVALVTGGGRGIGRAIAYSFARRGANVVVGYFRNREAAEDSCRSIEEEGVKAVAIKAHVGDEERLRALFGEVEEMFGRLDVFVSNAATGVLRPLVDLDARAWAWTMDSNARALFLGARHAAELMTEGGNIIAVSSLGASRVLPDYGLVGASKAVVESLVRYLAVELAPKIRVNAVSPGVVDTDALTHFERRNEMIGTAKRTTPAGRLVTESDVADVVGFLTSDHSAMVTGQTLVVDGGASLLA